MAVTATERFSKAAPTATGRRLDPAHSSFSAQFPLFTVDYAHGALSTVMAGKLVQIEAERSGQCFGLPIRLRSAGSPRPGVS